MHAQVAQAYLHRALRTSLACKQAEWVPVMTTSAAPQAQRRRPWLIAGGVALLAAAAIIAGVLGSRQAASGKGNAKSEPVKATTTSAHDPYTALVKAATIKPVNTNKTVTAPGDAAARPLPVMPSAPAEESGPVEGEENWDTQTYQPPAGGIAGAISNVLSGGKAGPGEASWKALGGGEPGGGVALLPQGWEGARAHGLQQDVVHHHHPQQGPQ